MEGLSRAFIGRPAPFSTRVLGRVWLSERDFELVLERPDGFRFRPGQGLGIEHQGRRREYTIVSTAEAGTLTLCVRRVKGGGLTTLLSMAEIGQPLDASGPHGYFDWEPSSRPAVFVATGIGMTPFVAMIRARLGPSVIAHGERRAEDLHYAGPLKEAAGRYVPCLSGAVPGADAPAGVYRGRVTGWLSTDLASGLYDFYLCGSRAMIADVVGVVDQRFPGSTIRTMAFS